MKDILVVVLMLVNGLCFAAICWYPIDALWQVRRRRRMEDTATSRIRAAAQGYVELQGRLLTPDGKPRIAPHWNVPCLWWRYRVSRFAEEKRVILDEGESPGPWVIDDGTGQCLVDPYEAGLIPFRELLLPKFNGVLERKVWSKPDPDRPVPELPKLPRWAERLVDPEKLRPQIQYEEEWLPFGVDAHLSGEFVTRSDAHFLISPTDGRSLKATFGTERELIRRSWVTTRRLPWVILGWIVSFGLMALLLWPISWA